MTQLGRGGLIGQRVFPHRRQASNQGSVSLSPEEVQRIQEEAEREAEEQRRRLEVRRCAWQGTVGVCVGG